MPIVGSMHGEQAFSLLALCVCVVCVNVNVWWMKREKKKCEGSEVHNVAVIHQKKMCILFVWGFCSINREVDKWLHTGKERMIYCICWRASPQLGHAHTAHCFHIPTSLSTLTKYQHTLCCIQFVKYIIKLVKYIIKYIPSKLVQCVYVEREIYIYIFVWIYISIYTHYLM